MSNSQIASACQEDPEIQTRSLYTELALHPEQHFGWNKGKENARVLGYDQIWLDSVLDEVWESAAAVGNPFLIGPIHVGETVVDFGCGAGADLCIAAMLVGETGRVIGIDFTPAMVEKARRNAALMKIQQIEVYLADIVNVPLPDECADVLISNGAINLSPRKACVLKDALRVLKPGGRFYIADVIRVADSPSRHSQSTTASGSWANCVAGTMSRSCFEQLLSDAGFETISFRGMTGYRTSEETEGALFQATKPTRVAQTRR
jgi:SAM-dependent methyltransferase